MNEGMIRSLATIVLVALAASGCRRDPGRDVKPMAATPAQVKELGTLREAVREAMRAQKKQG